MSAAGGIITEVAPLILAGAVAITAAVVWVFAAAGRPPEARDHGDEPEAGWRPHMIEAGDGGLDRLFDGLTPRIDPAHGWTPADEAAAEAQVSAEASRISAVSEVRK